MFSINTVSVILLYSIQNTMSRSVILFILNLLISNNQVCGAKILAVFPSPSISHQMVFRPLTQELAKRGHEVTVITADPAFTQENRPDNLIEIDVHNVSYNLWRETLKEFDITFGKKKGIYKVLEEISYHNTAILDAQLRTKEVQNILNDANRKYDLLLLEFCARPALMFSHVFKAPIIQISSFGLFQGMKSPFGISVHPIIYPGSIQQRLFNLTFWEKLEEIYKIIWFTQLWFNRAEYEQKVLAKYFGGDVPAYSELVKNINMIFINVHPMWSSNQPLPPNIANIWGIDKKQEKSLPQDLKLYMDSSKNGVIYLSFGSNTKSSLLPRNKIQLFLDACSKLPYDILWKWEEDDLPGKSKNIKISKWLPQYDLLSHPNLKLFITQGGLQSTQEAINAGVPMVGIPMLGDQWYNVELYEYHRIGISLDFEEITEEALTDAIQTVLNDPSYKENIIKLRGLLSDQSEGALQRAVWWSEYVLRHGGAKHLRAAGANLSVMEYYEVELLLELLLLFLCLAGVFSGLVYVLYTYVNNHVYPRKVKTLY